MAKLSQTDRAIAQLQSEINVLEAAIQRLRQTQVAKVALKAAVRPHSLPMSGEGGAPQIEH